jgi:hypothetical protein
LHACPFTLSVRDILQMQSCKFGTTLQGKNGRQMQEAGEQDGSGRAPVLMFPSSIIILGRFAESPSFVKEAGWVPEEETKRKENLTFLLGRTCLVELKWIG